MPPENASQFPTPRRSKPMPLKYWSKAGLMLTDWCGGACESCYLRCSPTRGMWMPVEMALGVWRGLVEASPHGCRVHLTGGEPFGDWPRLLEIVRRGAAEGLSADKIETSACWATDESILRERLRTLDAAGARMLCISCDPFHQRFVPIERVRRAVRVAEEVLGPERVQVRWRDWLKDGCDTDRMGRPELRKLFAEWLARGRDRLNGRAAECLAALLPLRPAEAFAGDNCREALLRGRGVHVGPGGGVIPGVCAGIILGWAERPYVQSIRDIWGRLEADHADRAVLGALADGGPAALMKIALPLGYRPAKGYASKCHLCWDVRRFLRQGGKFADELGPAGLYEDS